MWKTGSETEALKPEVKAIQDIVLYSGAYLSSLIIINGHI